MKKTKESTKEFKATVKIFGKTFTATDSSVAGAISKLKPGNCKGKCVLIVECDGVKKEKILMPLITFRLFGTHGLSKEIALKNASLLFNGI